LSESETLGRVHNGEVILNLSADLSAIFPDGSMAAIPSKSVTRRRLLAGDPGAGAIPGRRRDPDSAHVLGGLPPRHPETAHQRIRHVGGKPIPDRRLIADLSVEHRVNLLASEALGDENVDQAGHADFASRNLHDRDYLGASQARAADQTGRLSAIETTHRYRGLQLRFWFPSVCKAHKKPPPRSRNR
jgi:hypothetical protein